MLPEESVSSVPVPVHERMEEIWSPPLCTWRPPARVDVPVPREMILPPESVRPFVEESPPIPAATPPVKVEVPDPPTRRVDDAWRRPSTLNAPDTVEDDCEMNPEFSVERPIERKAPPVVKSEEAVEDPLEMNPLEPKVARPVTRRVEEAWSVE